jgi:hypothetical protein
LLFPAIVHCILVLRLIVVKLLRCRWWIIRPEGDVASIGLNITFLSVERGYDVVTIFSCPSGHCQQLIQYSDHDLTEVWYNAKDVLYYYGDKVKCNSVLVNTDELRIRFTSDGKLYSDGELLQDAEKPDSFSYTGFSAAYWSSQSPVDKEVIGCPKQNITYSEMEGSIFAVDSRQLFPVKVVNSSASIHELYFDTSAFETEYSRRQCLSASERDCTMVARGESKWWILSPILPSDASRASKIVVAFHKLVLDDSLDVLNIYTRNQGITTKMASLSGINPFVGSSVVKCRGCSSGCHKYIGASGTFSELSEDGADCMWLIDTSSQYMMLKLKFVSSASTDYFSVTSCSGSSEVTCSEQEQQIAVENSHEERKLVFSGPMTRIKYKSQGPGVRGFELSWQTVCPSKPYTASSGHLLEEAFYYAHYYCVYKIVPASASSVTINFTNISGFQASVYDGMDDALFLGSVTTWTIWSGSMFTSSSGAISIVIGSEQAIGGFELSWSSTYLDENEQRIVEDNENELPDDVKMEPLDTCNHMVFSAEEVLLNLETSMFPTYSSGFWLDFWVAYDGDHQHISNLTRCTEQNMYRIVMSEALVRGHITYSNGELYSYGLSETGKEINNIDSAGTSPNRRLVWILKAPVGAKSVKIQDLVSSLEDGYDILIISSCVKNDCAPVYRRTTDSGAFCSMELNTDELRVELQFDSTNNYQAWLQMPWEWSEIESREIKNGNCPNFVLDEPSGNISQMFNLSGRQQPTTVILRPDPGTKSITIDFNKPLSLSRVFFDCGSGTCKQMQIPSNQYRACSYSFASREIRLNIQSDELLNVVYTSSKITAPAAVIDGDCRLTVEGADNLLTNNSGNITFDAETWMEKNGRGIGIEPSRIRWVIRPDQPTKTIILSFHSMELSPDWMVDTLYVAKDCNSFRKDPANWIFHFPEFVGLNGHALARYGRTRVPCPVTFHRECIVLELDISERFQRNYHPNAEFSGSFKGFSATYTSYPYKVGTEALFKPGGLKDICVPAYLQIPAPKPTLVWKELCCTQEDGNEVFRGNFWGHLSIDIDIPSGEDREDYKVIYRVEAYNPAGALQMNSFECGQSAFDTVEGWYPSEMTEQDMQLLLKSKWEASHTRAYPGILTNETLTMIGKLWYDERKFVRIHGKSKVVDASAILLNAPRASSDRPLTVPAMHEHTMISAVTCKALRDGGQTTWIKSEVAVMDQIFSQGPSVTFSVSLLEQSADLVNFREGNSNVTEQLLLSSPVIETLRKDILSVLKLPDRSLGVLKQLEAINISVARAPRSRRDGYKATFIAKPDFNRSAWYESAQLLEVAEEQVQDHGLYNVNITFSILCKSVQEAAYFEKKLSQSRRQLLRRLTDMKVHVPESTKVSQGGSCRSHYHCTPTGLFCSSKKVCESCRLCSTDKFDSIDGTCPQDLCPKSGGFPECVDSDKLLKDIKKCQASYPFSVWSYVDAKTEVVPEVQPKAQPRPKYVTPHNRLVGALMVTQKRRRQANCSVDNSRMQKYLDTSRTTCQSHDDMDPSPFSLDPTFQRFSEELYNGKLEVDSTYFDIERAADKDNSPYAFFPHEHNPIRSQGAASKQSLSAKRKLTVVNRTSTDLTKDELFIHKPSRKLFKLYFDELLTGRQADRMLAYLRDGKFIDSK